MRISEQGKPLTRTAVLLLAAAILTACAANFPASPTPRVPDPPDQVFTLSDGASLPYRTWLPAEKPSIVVLALHGFDDSEDAWELPAPVMAEAGIAVIAPDQRGFGAAPDRGRWPGTTTLVADAAAMARVVHARYPDAKLYLMGESMGGAILMSLAATHPAAPPIAGYVLISPAVWGWDQMNLPLRAVLYLTNAIAPALILSPGPVRVHASDNRAALIRLSTDPRTIRKTRVAAVKGLVDLMSQAQFAAPHITEPALILYGGHDELVPAPATRAAWRALPATVTRAYYPGAYHLMLRDHDRAPRITDIIAWLKNPAAPLPSGAQSAATAFLAGKPARQALPSPPNPG